VLLNATRSEAAALLEEPPPRPGSLHDSAEEPQLDPHLRGYLEHEEWHASVKQQQQPKVWAPPSRSSASYGGGGRPQLPHAANGLPK